MSSGLFTPCLFLKSFFIFKNATLTYTMSQNNGHSNVPENTARGFEMVRGVHHVTLHHVTFRRVTQKHHVTKGFDLTFPISKTRILGVWRGRAAPLLPGTLSWTSVLDGTTSRHPPLEHERLRCSPRIVHGLLFLRWPEFPTSLRAYGLRRQLVAVPVRAGTAKCVHS